MNMELTFFDSNGDIFTQHQMLHILTWNNHALFAGQTLQLAGIKETFNFGIDTAHWLYLSQLVHRAGNGPGLINRQLANRREQGRQLRDCGTVSIDLTIALFKGQRSREVQGLFTSKMCFRERRHLSLAFSVQAATEFHTALNVENVTTPLIPRSSQT